MDNNQQLSGNKVNLPADNNSANLVTNSERSLLSTYLPRISLTQNKRSHSRLVNDDTDSDEEEEDNNEPTTEGDTANTGSSSNTPVTTPRNMSSNTTNSSSRRRPSLGNLPESVFSFNRSNNNNNTSRRTQNFHQSQPSTPQTQGPPPPSFHRRQISHPGNMLGHITQSSSSIHSSKSSNHNITTPPPNQIHTNLTCELDFSDQPANSSSENGSPIEPEGMEEREENESLILNDHLQTRARHRSDSTTSSKSKNQPTSKTRPITSPVHVTSKTSLQSFYATTTSHTLSSSSSVISMEPSSAQVNHVNAGDSIKSTSSIASIPTTVPYEKQYNDDSNESSEAAIIQIDEPDFPEIAEIIEKKYTRHCYLVHVAPHRRADIWRAFLTFIYVAATTFLCTFVLQLTHERMDERAQNEPLRDVAFDIVTTRIPWAFDITEIVVLIYAMFVAVLLFLHKERLIILRRLFAVIGTLYLYRSALMYSTNLPVPGTHLKCAKKSQGDIGLLFGRALMLWIGGGMSLGGGHMYCGDYMYSGHTCVIMTFYLFLSIYVPRSNAFLKTFHYALTFTTYAALICILLGHDHYTIDIICAYYVSTRLIYTYHTCVNIGLSSSEANNLSQTTHHAADEHLQSSKLSNAMHHHQSSSRTLKYHLFDNLWWWRIFLFLEKHSLTGHPEFRVQPVVLCSSRQVQSFSDKRRQYKD